MVFYSAVVFAISSLALGYDQGIMSVAKVRIQTDLGLSELRVDVLVGFLGIFAAIGRCRNQSLSFHRESAREH